MLAPRARCVVGHGEAQQQEQEEQGCDHDQLGEFFAGMPDMHEEERDQSRFQGRDAQRNCGVESPSSMKAAL